MNYYFTKRSITAALVESLQDIAYARKEYLVCFSLNRSGRVITRTNVFIGSTSEADADPREIFRQAVSDGAQSIVIAHNHPSGIAEPSDSDIEVTKHIITAGRQLDIPLIDHIIVAENHYFSFREQILRYRQTR